MVKVLRKYNKVLLVGFGVLLMVTFLLPGQSGPRDTSGRKIATIGQESVTAGQFEKAELEFTALEMLIPDVLKDLLGVENGTHWLLLSHEAERAGFVGEGGDGPDWFSELATTRVRQAVQAGQLRPEDSSKAVTAMTDRLEAGRAQLAGHTRLTPPDIDRAIAKARGVMRMVNYYYFAGKLSDRRYAQAAGSNLDSVYVDLVFIPGRNLDDPTKTPSDEQLQAQFDKYRDAKPGSGEFGFGYLQPPRVKLEWLRLDRKAIGDAIVLDQVEVNKRWRTSRDKYPGLFEAEQKKVEDELRNEKVGAIFSDAGQTVRAEVLRVTRDLRTDGKYLVLPSAEEWAKVRPDLERIAQSVVEAIKSKHGVEIPKPVVTRFAENWMTASDLQLVPGFGRSSTRLAATALPGPAVALSVKELALGNDIGVQVGVPVIENAPVDSAGNKYYFTVLEARPEGPADTLAEVKDRVISDVESMEGYQALIAKTDEIKAAAVASGLEEAAKPFGLPGTDADGKPTPPRAPPVMRFQRLPRRDDPSQWPSELREAAWKAAESMDPKAPAVADAKDPASYFTAAIPTYQGMRGLIVGHVLAVRPMTRELARVAVDSQSNETMGDELLDAEAVREHSPFRYETMRTRLNFRMLRESGEEKAPEEQKKTQDPSAPLKGT
jgi:hypothetical protein